MNSLNFSAHPDDDLLYMNPDIAEDLERGDKAIVVYVTAGDDGRDVGYAVMREQASRAAYELPKYNKSTYRMGIKSNSFRNGDTYGDLYKLWTDHTYVAKSLWNVEFTFDSLIRSIRSKIQSNNPDLIRVHNPFASPAIDHDEPHLDHLDHIYSAKFVIEAARGLNIPIWCYEGYPIRYYADNVTDPHLIELKTKMWRAYQEIDTEVAGAIWDIAMTRQYKKEYVYDNSN